MPWIRANRVRTSGDVSRFRSALMMHAAWQNVKERPRVASARPTKLLQRSDLTLVSLIIAVSKWDAAGWLWGHCGAVPQPGAGEQHGAHWRCAEAARGHRLERGRRRGGPGCRGSRGNRTGPWLGRSSHCGRSLRAAGSQRRAGAPGGHRPVCSGRRAAGRGGAGSWRAGPVPISHRCGRLVQWRAAEPLPGHGPGAAARGRPRRCGIGQASSPAPARCLACCTVPGRKSSACKPARARRRSAANGWGLGTRAAHPGLPSARCLQGVRLHHGAVERFARRRAGASACWATTARWRPRWSCQRTW